MFTARFFRHASSIFVLFLVIISVLFSPPAWSKEYAPVVGQEGKDVVWVPTALALANKMLDLAKVTAQDYVIDLGSGDGRIVITAAKRGARAVGIEYNPDLVVLSKSNAAREGVADRAQFIKADLFETDFSQATVITMFLLPHINLKLRPKLLNLKPGTRVVSNSFTMEEWQADQTVAVSPQEGCDNDYCEAYLWIVPAKVEGTWKLPQGELALKQSFQMISGTLRTGPTNSTLRNGRLNGNQINFTVGADQYTGTISGNTMQGTSNSGGIITNWSATRQK